MADKDPLILDFRNGRVLDGDDLVTAPVIMDVGQAMMDDGVDPNDHEAVNDWLTEYYSGGDEEPDPSTWYDIDFKEALNLPPVLPPLRLPDETALAAQARQSEILAGLRSLADEVRTTRVKTATVSPFLLKVAEETELVERDGDGLIPGEDVAYLDDLSDDPFVLKAWDFTFAMILDTTLEAADETDPVVGDLDWGGIAATLMLKLFLSRWDGVPVAVLTDDCRTVATVDLEEDEAEQQWREWIDAHGDPAQLLLSQLGNHGALSVTDGIVKLEPLGLSAVRSKLEEDRVLVSLLPPLDQMTPDHLVLVRLDGTEQDFEEELTAWTAPRGTEQAARELLAFAAKAEAVTRMATITIVSHLGQDAEPAWREALDSIQLRCYAKTEIAKFAGLGPDAPDLPAELESTREDLAWLLADTLGPISRMDFGQKTFPLEFPEFKRVRELQRPDEVFETMARLDHPDAETVLTLIGKHADDKQTAKAARRAAYKASTRRASTDALARKGLGLT